MHFREEFTVWYKVELSSTIRCSTIPFTSHIDDVQCIENSIVQYILTRHIQLERNSTVRYHTVHHHRRIEKYRTVPYTNIVKSV
jgi:hypothetical protein